MRKHLLFSLLLALNLFFLALLVYAWTEGVVWGMISSDRTGFMMWTILFVGGFGVVWTVARSWQATRGHQFVPHISAMFPTLLTGLGLLGTVMGLAIMVSHMNFNVGDVAATKTALGVVLSGFGLAINTTIAGLIFALWVGINNAVMAVLLRLEEAI